MEGLPEKNKKLLKFPGRLVPEKAGPVLFVSDLGFLQGQCETVLTSKPSASPVDTMMWIGVMISCFAWFLPLASYKAPVHTLDL
jgi:hypothetical protein